MPNCRHRLHDDIGALQFEATRSCLHGIRDGLHDTRLYTAAPGLVADLNCRRCVEWLLAAHVGAMVRLIRSMGVQDRAVQQIDEILARGKE